PAKDRSLLATYCVYSGKAFDDLEKGLARLVYAHLRHLAEAATISGTTTPALADAITRCARRAHLPTSIGVVDAAWKELREVRQAALSEARRRLTHRLAALVEAFKGTAGWLFVATPSPEWKQLTAVVAHNTPEAILHFGRDH